MSDPPATAVDILDAIGRLPTADQAQAPSACTIENTVLRIVSAALDTPIPSLDTTFGTLGGNSLSAARIIARIWDTLGVQLSLGELTPETSLQSLATAVRSATSRRGLRSVTDVAWLNGQLVPLALAAPSVASSTFNMGTGVFDGLMAYWNTDHWYLHRAAEHLSRFQHGSTHMDLASRWSADTLRHGAHDLLKHCRPRTTYIRPITYRPDPELLLVTAQKAPVSVCMFGVEVQRDIDEPVSCELSSVERVSSNAIPVAWKVCGAYANSFLAQRGAMTNGFDTALLLDRRGFISEAAAANVFFLSGQRIVTPALHADVFPGITRSLLLRLCRELNLDAAERDVHPRELDGFDAAFLCSTLLEMRPISQIAGYAYGSASHPVFTALLDHFRAITHEASYGCAEHRRF
jgi:branched-chain amino acid aminotransferase